jgi:hypothetical protein
MGFWRRGVVVVWLAFLTIVIWVAVTAGGVAWVAHTDPQWLTAFTGSSSGEGGQPKTVEP